MSTISAWDDEYARLARAASQLRTPGILTGVGDVESLHKGLMRLERALDDLPLEVGEIQRRKRLVQHLQQTTPAPGAAAASNRTTNIDVGGPGGRQSQMAMAMQQQDALIDELAVGMGRLKNQTVAISDEARMHVNLLNDMETNLDAAHSGLLEETRRAARLKEDQSVWRLQLIVAALSVLLILLIFLGLTP